MGTAEEAPAWQRGEVAMRIGGGDRGKWARRLGIAWAAGGLLAAATVAHATTQGIPGAGGTLWVTNTSKNDVTVFDVGSGAVIETIPVGSKPIGITAPPGTGKVYVSNESSNSVSVISKATLSVLGAIPLPVGSKPHHMTHSPDGTTIYVALFGTNKVAFIGTATDTATIHTAGPTAARTHAVWASQDGTTIYVTNSIVNQVQALDAKTGEMIGAGIPVGANPSEVLATADHKRAYVSVRDADEVEVIDLATGEEIGSTPVGDQPDTLTLAPDGKTLMVALRGGPPGTVSVIDVADPGLATTSMVVGGATTGHQALSANGKFAFVTVVGGAAPSPGVAVLELSSGTVLHTYPYPGGGSPHGIVYEPSRLGLG